MCKDKAHVELAYVLCHDRLVCHTVWIFFFKVRFNLTKRSKRLSQAHTPFLQPLTLTFTFTCPSLFLPLLILILLVFLFRAKQYDDKLPLSKTIPLSFIEYNINITSCYKKNKYQYNFNIGEYVDFVDSAGNGIAHRYIYQTILLSSCSTSKKCKRLSLNPFWQSQSLVTDHVCTFYWARRSKNRYKKQKHKGRDCFTPLSPATLVIDYDFF